MGPAEKDERIIVMNLGDEAEVKWRSEGLHAVIKVHPSISFTSHPIQGTSQDLSQGTQMDEQTDDRLT